MMFCRCLSESEAGLPTLGPTAELGTGQRPQPDRAALPFCRWQLANGRLLTKALGSPSGKLPQLVARGS